MRKVLLVVGAAALATSMPVLAAGPHGKGGSKGSHVMSAKHGTKSKVSSRSNNTYSKANARARTRTSGLTDTNRDGRVNSRDVLDGNLDGVDDRTGNRYGSAACPPGLAKKSPACIPPGQAKREFAQGQRIPQSYNAFTDYNAIPQAYRTQVPYSTVNQYIYRDNQVFVVDPATRLVTSIINLIR